MKIDLSKIGSDFVVRPVEINGGEFTLIHPNPEPFVWRYEDRFLRSCVVDAEGEVVSMGFPKFVNLGENEEEFGPHGDELFTGKVEVFEKLDGSLIIVDVVDGKLNVRSRETSTVERLDSGDEILMLVRGLIGDIRGICDGYSLLFEYVSRRNQIVLDYGENPRLYLVGRVSHANGELTSQQALHGVASYFGVARPRYYSFNDLEGFISDVRKWEGKEGVCIYVGGQTIYKVKSEYYLKLHREVETFNSPKKLLDIYFEGVKEIDLWTANKGLRTHDALIHHLHAYFEHETIQLRKHHAQTFMNAVYAVLGKTIEIREIVRNYLSEDRKDFAERLNTLLPNKWERGIAFQLFDWARPVKVDRFKKWVKRELKSS